MAEDRLLPILGRITRTLASKKPFDTTLKLVAREIARLLRANQCSIMLLDDQKQELLFKQSYGLTREELLQIRFRLGEGVAGWVVLEKTTARVDDVTKDPRFKAFPLQKSKIASILCVPLLSENQAIGVISLSSPNEGAFSHADQILLEHLSIHTATEIQVHRQYELSVTDPLTHMYNEAYFRKNIKSEVERAWRYRDQLGLCLIHNETIDREEITTNAEKTKEVLRKSDLSARLENGKMAILFPDTDRDALIQIASRIQETTPGASIGLALYPEDGTDGEELMLKADECLENAIARGGNRFEVDL